MAGEGEGSSPSLQNTPVWALATVCFVFIALSIFIEHLIHLLCNWLKRHRKTSLFEAVEKLKSVLMILGLMSLILAVAQRFIYKICIPTTVANSMLPCRKSMITTTTKALGLAHIWTGASEHHFPATEVFEDFPSQPERRLASADNSTSDYCSSRGKTSFISQDGILQLNIFVFVLAAMQIVYSVLTMALGRAKMRRWEAWEKETQRVDYQVANDPNRFRYTKQTTFGRRHMSNSFTQTSSLLWIKCFFRQFFNSVAKVDYLTMRHGFISAHLSTNNAFNFQKFIQRTLEDDFKAVVGISPIMWFIVVIFMLLDVHGWHVYLWVSFLPLIIVLVLGTKLEVIVATMALQLQSQNSVIKGSPVVQPNDNHFWFKQPKFVLSLLHLVLFVNAFELAFFVWVTWQYGIKSCYHESTAITIIRVVLPVTVQVLCSYITLPLYALVTQMGSQYKSTGLEEQTVHAIKQWYAETRDRRKNQKDISQSGRDYSSSYESSSNRTIGSPESSSHRRILSFAHENTHRSNETEIVEEHPGILQDDQLDHGPAMVSSDMVSETPMVHCGFYSDSGGFKISKEDKDYMKSCKAVVSTCAFGGGDDLYQPIGMSEASFREVCYVAFWDEITLRAQELGGHRIGEDGFIGRWRIVVVRELPFTDQRLNGKIPKMLSHHLFPHAKYSLWVDSKAQFRRDPLGVLEALLWRSNSVRAISEHGARSSVFDEAKAVVKKNKATPEEVEVQLTQYRNDGFPKDKRFNGKKALSEASVIVREHTPLTNLFMCLWFNEVVRFTSRDQLSFPYVLWRLRVLKNINTFPVCTRKDLVNIMGHIRKAKPLLS